MKSRIHPSKIASNGDGRPETVPDVESIDKADHQLIMSYKVQIENLKRKQAELHRELTLVSADVYRKSDELNELMDRLTKKHGLKAGQREVDLKTGNIVDPRNKTSS